MKRYISAGVRKEGSGFAIDYNYNAPDDIIYITEPQLYSSEHNNNTYYFGYRFTDDSSSTDRTEFIHSVKQIGDNPLSDGELEKFIKRPLKYLNAAVNLNDIDCIIYPVSNRSPLVSKMIRCVNDMTPHGINRGSYELVKQAPTELGFDFDAFESDHYGEQGYDNMIKHINETLMPKLHSLDYFSIARNVKAKYRPYITGFLDFKDLAELEKFSKLQGSNVLVIDDINTTGSTLNEILRILNSINRNCNIYVYTLIGK